MISKRTLTVALTAMSMYGGGNALEAAVTGPYIADASTLHLWHMDEANPGPAQPAPGVAGSFNLTPTNGATLGAPGALNFGTAGSTAGATNRGFQGATIPVSSVTGAGGAFTFEALVNTSSITATQQIYAMDNGGPNADRPFQYRIGGGAFQFINIADPAGIQSIAATIPTTGDNAFVADKWYHVAVTYDGNENTAGNMQFYWTRLADYNTQANLIGTGSMRADLGGVATALGVGNEYRGAPDNNINGRVDEARISGVARSSGQFAFAADGPTLLFQDRFNDNSIGNTASQSGSVAPVGYTTASGTFTEADGSLTITPTGGSGSITPNHNFNTADIAAAGGFNIQLTDVNPVVGGNGDSGNWVGVSMFRAAGGDGGGAPDVTGSPLGVLFRDNGAFNVFSNGSNIGSGTFVVPSGADLLYDLRLEVDLDSFGINDSAAIALFFGEATDPFFTTSISGVDLTNNFITFESRSSASTIGNIRISLNTIPEPASAMLLVFGALAVGRRRSARRA